MADFNLGEGVRKVFLAGVGAIAMGAEKSGQIIDDLVKKGELTVEQGKVLNEELTRKASQAVGDTQDAFLRSRMEGMTAEERAAYAQKIADMAAEMDARATTVEAEVEEVEETEEAAAADEDAQKADEE